VYLIDKKNNDVHKWQDVKGKGPKWHKIGSQKGKKIAVNYQGVPFVIGLDGSIWWAEGSKTKDDKDAVWNQLNGKAKEIAFDPNGDLYILGDVKGSKANKILKYFFATREWLEQESSGDFERIAAYKNELWAINSAADIFRKSSSDGSKWEKMPGKANEISIGPDGSVVKIYNEVISKLRWKDNNWIDIGGQGKYEAVAVGRNGRVFTTVDGVPMWPDKACPEPEADDDKKCPCNGDKPCLHNNLGDNTCFAKQGKSCPAGTTVCWFGTRKATCASEPQNKKSYTLKGYGTKEPTSSLAGNWVVYNTPEKSGKRSPAAPDSCMEKADGTKYVFGDEVPNSCCSKGRSSETNFRDRATQSGGYCSALPKNDKFIGPLDGPHAETWSQFRGLAFCHAGTRAVFGEFCG